MHAELRSLFSSDVEDLASYAPGDTFCVTLRALIGPLGSAGEESFDFGVCSPNWLAAEVEREGIVAGRFYVIAATFDYEAIRRHVAKRIAQASGADWNEVAAKLARWFQWEFEDYVEFPSSS